MAIGFPKPRFTYEYSLRTQLRALREYPEQPDRADRAIPPKSASRLLLATWNIANLGVQKRRRDDYRLLAEIISWFDLVALQEVNANLDGLRALQDELPTSYRALFSDPGGNQERFAFLYDSEKIVPLEEVGEMTLTPAELTNVRLADIPARFVGFDRNPMLASFRARDTPLLLASVHLYFGDSRGGGQPDDEALAVTRSPATRAAAEQLPEPPPAAGMDRRVLEAYAIARWSSTRHRSKYAYTSNVIALGDFNLPVKAPGDRVYDALTRHGLQLPDHATKVGGSNLSDDAHYDQMAMYSGELEPEQLGVFDFDGAVFRDLWGEGTESEQIRFRAYVKYYLSDHRPLWTALPI
jgi:endonuclease/exonuclease/phosphatase family metal-dependent hydrolase